MGAALSLPSATLAEGIEAAARRVLAVAGVADSEVLARAVLRAVQAEWGGQEHYLHGVPQRERDAHLASLSEQYPIHVVAQQAGVHPSTVVRARRRVRSTGAR